MRVGALDRRCSLLQAQSVEGAGGSRLETWAEVGKAWAEITIPTGRIAAVAEQLTALVTAEIRVRFRKSIVAGMRIKCGDTTYLIEAVLPDAGRVMLRLLCSNVPNP